MLKNDPYAMLPAAAKQEHFDKMNAYKDELRRNPQLRSLFIEMTLDCNEHCLHCGSRAGEGQGHASASGRRVVYKKDPNPIPLDAKTVSLDAKSVSSEAKSVPSDAKSVLSDANPVLSESTPASAPQVSCLHSNIDRPLTDEEILITLKRLKRDLTGAHQPLPFLNITGGEPMLRPHLAELMTQIHALGYRWGMTSNGLLITEDAAKALKAAGMYSISISLDGMEENHDWFRQHKGGWKKALEAIDHLIAAGIKSVMITTVVNQRNKNELEQVKEVVKAHNCKLWRIINIDPIGRALDNPELLLTREDYRNMINYIVSLQDDPDMSVIYTCNYYLGLDLERRVRPWYFFCRAGLQLASIQYNGDISACLDIERRPELIFGNVREEDFYKVWRKGFSIYREHKEEKSSKCSKCRHKENCQGSGWHTWNFDTNEPRICMLEELGEEIP